MRRSSRHRVLVLRRVCVCTCTRSRCRNRGPQEPGQWHFRSSCSSRHRAEHCDAFSFHCCDSIAFHSHPHSQAQYPELPLKVVMQTVQTWHVRTPRPRSINKCRETLSECTPRGRIAEPLQTVFCFLRLVYGLCCASGHPEHQLRCLPIMFTVAMHNRPTKLNNIMCALACMCTVIWLSKMMTIA
jgi:hypothetical protein